MRFNPEPNQSILAVLNSIETAPQINREPASARIYDAICHIGNAQHHISRSTPRTDDARESLQRAKDAIREAFDRVGQMQSGRAYDFGPLFNAIAKIDGVEVLHKTSGLEKYLYVRMPKITMEHEVTTGKWVHETDDLALRINMKRMQEGSRPNEYISAARWSAIAETTRQHNKKYHYINDARLKEGRLDDGHITPHIKSGNICWGDTHDAIRRLVNAAAWEDVFANMFEIACRYNVESPFQRIHYFGAKFIKNDGSEMANPICHGSAVYDLTVHRWTGSEFVPKEDVVHSRCMRCYIPKTHAVRGAQGHGFAPVDRLSAARSEGWVPAPGLENVTTQQEAMATSGLFSEEAVEQQADIGMEPGTYIVTITSDNAAQPMWSSLKQGRTLMRIGPDGVHILKARGMGEAVEIETDNVVVHEEFTAKSVFDPANSTLFKYNAKDIEGLLRGQMVTIMSPVLNYPDDTVTAATLNAELALRENGIYPISNLSLLEQ